MYTAFNTNSAVEEECKNYVKKLNHNICSSFSNNLLVSFGSNIKRLSPVDILRIIYETESVGNFDKILKSAIIEMAMTSEKRVPGSSLYALLMFNEMYLSRYFDEELNEDILKLCKISKRSNLETALEHLSKISKKDIDYSILESVINHGGFNSAISVKEWDAWDSKIEITSYNNFDAYIPPEFLLSSKIDEWECKDCDVIVIDGLIDSVSEIHHLLESYNQSKRNLCLVARGFAGDVISTLSVNFLRKTLRVVPVQIKINLNTINSLKDISVVCIADMVSSLKGDIISSIDLDTINSVDWIKASNNSFFISNADAEPQISVHISNLKKKISEENSEDVIKLLENRISNMSPKSAKVFLGRHLGENIGITKDRLRLNVAILNSICRFGIIKLEDIDTENLNKATSSMINLLKDYKINFTPAGSLVEGLKIGIKTAVNLKKAGGYIMVD